MITKTICLIIDGLRSECLCSTNGRKMLFPNLDKIIKHGAVYPATSNAQSTQFVMPSIFCQNYPLDYGGYSDGIVHRPVSYIELVHKAGYETQMISSCNQLGVASGYSRGFDKIKATIDFRVILEQNISRNLAHYFNELKNLNLNVRDKENIEKELLDDYKKLLRAFIDTIHDTDTSVWGKKLAYYNHLVSNQSQHELTLIDTNKELILKRLSSIPAGVYWYALGKKRIPMILFFLLRLKVGITWRWRKHTRNMPILLSHWVSVSSEIFQELINELKNSEKIKKQHFHLHVMDVHDCISFNRIFIKIYHFKFFPKWIYAKLHGFTDRRLLYDLSLMYVDEKIGDLMNALEDKQLTDKTAIVISGDHGSSYAESPRNYKHVYFRTYYEDISIPIVAYNCNKNISTVPGKLRDSMSITATLLDFMKILPDKSFLGMGITNSNSNDFVISESCDSRKPNGLQTNLFYTILNEKYKVMIVLIDDMLHIRHLFDRERDLKELVDIKKDKGMLPIIECFIDILFLKRKELLTLRKIKRESWILK